MAASMRSARLHEPGRPLRIDMVEIPEPRPRDVLVQVKACGVIPNMNAIFSGRLWNHLPPLPASVGLDAAGVQELRPQAAYAPPTSRVATPTPTLPLSGGGSAPRPLQRY